MHHPSHAQIALALLFALTACKAPFSTSPRPDDDDTSSPPPDSSDGSDEDMSEDPDDSPPDDGDSDDQDEAPDDDDPAPDPDAGGPPPPPPPPPGEPCDFAYTRHVQVSGTSELASALSEAEAGTLIELEDGTYAGSFRLEASGRGDAPIILCGSASAVLEGNSGKNTLTLAGDHWTLSGFTVTAGLRGVVLDGANDSKLVGLTVHHIGQEAIHLLNHSSRNVVERCRVFDTGIDEPGFGEGIYLGSARSNWEKVTGSDAPDRSNDNQVLDNELGPDIRAEHIDVKEGTEGGLVRGNTFHGQGISGENYADSWIDVKGNDYLVENNVGEDSPADGFQTHVIEDWGHDIVFRGNVARVNGDGYGFSVSGDGRGIVVECSNMVEDAGSGFANVACSL